MRRITRIVVRVHGVAALLCLVGGTAQATDSIWNHNGSEMLWHADGANRTISYQNPRQGLPVAPGTVLFEGRRVDDGQPNTPDILEGTARLFRQGCLPAEYYVSGPILEETHVILHGAAPIRAASGCTVTGYSDTSSNATLEFTYLRSTGGTAPGVNTSGGTVITRPADEEYGEDAVGYQDYSVPLPGGSQIAVHVDIGVGSHVMPDVITAQMVCPSGARRDILPSSPPFYTCMLQDVSADLIGHNLILDALQYDNDTGACSPLRFQYSYAGLCN